MNGRPSKTTVDYFPHYTASGKTLFTLESLYGNDGYAFWFKLLEILGSSENHTFRYENMSDWLYLVAKTKVAEERALSILQTLADLGAIDKDLHQNKTVWSENFVLGLLPVYKKRSTEIPSRPTFRGDNKVSGEKTPQSKVKESKGEKTLPLSDYTESFESFWKEYPNKKGKFKAFSSWKKYKCENGIFEKIMESLEDQKQSKDWIKENGRFIPNGSTWVVNKGWEDEIESTDEWGNKI